MRFFAIFFLLALVLAIPFFVWGSYFEISFSQESTTSWLQELGSWAWIAALGLLAADIVLPIPSTGVMAALGVVYGPVLGGLIGACGSALSATIAYGACRLLGQRAAARIAGEEDLRRGEVFFQTTGGGWAVALSRWLPLLPEVIACLAGLAKMPLLRFLVALACGSIPMAFTFAIVGWSGRASPTLALTLSAVVPLILWPLAARLLRRQTQSNIE